MQSVIASLAKAVQQLGDPAILRVLAKSFAITLVVFIAVGVAVFQSVIAAAGYLGFTANSGAAYFTAMVLTLVAGWLLFRVVALAVLQFFADDIVRAVEQKHYPEAAACARDLPFREDLLNSLRGIGRTVGFNLLALPVALVLLFTAIGPAIIFLLVNAVLLGRELTDMAWLRHREPSETTSPVGALDRLLLGGAIAGLMLMPFVNLLAPIIGAAAGTHLTHRFMSCSRAINGSDA